MPYNRPKNPIQLSKDQKVELLTKYFKHYQGVAETDPARLNVKSPREGYHDLLGQIGELLLAASAAAATEPGPVRTFLQANPVPLMLEGLLPDEFRAFCLALNALKQWVSAEQAATDRYILGGTARESCRKAAVRCVLTGQPLDDETIELHHPVRDGRPPIPVSKTGHARIEKQGSTAQDVLHQKLSELKREGHFSWVMLRRGCKSLLDQPVPAGNASVLASAKTFARKASRQTRLTYDQLLAWLDEKGL